MTGQVLFDSYEEAGAIIAVHLVNELAVEHAFGRPVQPADPVPAIRRILETDPTWPPLRRRDVAGFITLADQLGDVFRSLHRGDVDAAARQLNDLLAAHPAHPHLSKDHGRWRLHHHPYDADLVPMATAICAEAMARVVAAGAGGHLGTCEADECDRVFFDQTKNGSRRFCSTTCQNRVKAAAFRRRRATTEV